jgi:flagellar biosynthesis/type III secretory pathway protein FliH
VSVRGNQDYSTVAQTLREEAEKIRAFAEKEEPMRACYRHAELLCVLARACEGKDLYKSFGAPGDWGYGTPIGDALEHAYSHGRSESENTEIERAEHESLARAEESGYAKGVAAGKALGINADLLAACKTTLAAIQEQATDVIWAKGWRGFGPAVHVTVCDVLQEVISQAEPKEAA